MPAIIKDGAAVEIFLGVAFTDAGGVQRPSNWLALATDDDKTAVGVLDIVEPPAAPSGKVVRATGLGLTNGVPTRVYDLVGAPVVVAPIYDPRGLIATLKGAVDTDGGIEGVENATGLQAAMEIMPGVYWFFFAQPLPDANYIVQPGYLDSTSIFDLKPTDQEVDFVEVTAVDRASGEPARPACISVTVFR